MEDGKIKISEQDPSKKGSTEATCASLQIETGMSNIDFLSDTTMSDEDKTVPMGEETQSDDDLDATVIPVRDNSPNRNPNQGTDPSIKTQKMQRMCGAAKRRLKALIAKGHTYEKARELAMAPMPPPTPKRQRSDGSTPETKDNHGNNKKKRRHTSKEVENSRSQDTEENPSGMDYKEALTGIRMGIIPKNFPAEMMSADEIDKLQDYIMEQVLGLEGAGFTPAFRGSAARQGWLMVTCGNEPTAEWLQRSADNFKPWEGAKLRALGEDLLPKPIVLTGYFPHSAGTETEKILKFVNIQNENLDTKEWKVLKRIEEGKSVLLALLIDAMSAEHLKRDNYNLNFRFGQVRLRARNFPKHKTGSGPNREDGDRARGASSGSGLVSESGTARMVESSARTRDKNPRQVQAGTSGRSRGLSLGEARAGGSGLCTKPWREATTSAEDVQRARAAQGQPGKPPDPEKAKGRLDGAS